VAPYVVFLLDLAAEGDVRIVPRSEHFQPNHALRPANAFIWKVVCDARGKVVVHAIGPDGGVIATAWWRDDDLREPQQKRPTVPTAYQWQLVEAALRDVLARRAQLGDLPGQDAVEDEHGVEARFRPAEPGWRLVEAPARAARRRVRWIAAAAGALVAAAVGLVVATRGSDDAPPPPHPVASGPAPVPVPAAPVVEPPAVQLARATSLAEALAIVRPTLAAATGEPGPGADLLVGYASAKLRWDELDGPAETSIAHVLKDAEAERGKRTCASGTISWIERRDVERRKTFAGRLRTEAGDELAFVAVGSSGDLVKRSQARFCGVVTGRTGEAATVIGMFDLPENRAPVVEQ